MTRPHAENYTSQSLVWFTSKVAVSIFLDLEPRPAILIRHWLSDFCSCVLDNQVTLRHKSRRP